MSDQATAPHPVEFPMRCRSCDKLLMNQDGWCGHQAVCTGGDIVEGGVGS